MTVFSDGPINPHETLGCQFCAIDAAEKAILAGFEPVGGPPDLLLVTAGTLGYGSPVPLRTMLADLAQFQTWGPDCEEHQPEPELEP